ncbi:hypothetical protein STCU_11898 [Strigomonas culicis]|uniref:Uncharacterized protein n=1 Tax=Strigomonas culicis TaxID=28005 RepID=S9TC88_9TRYP|nr:hypothetical protein STCU_11898 [Strigomonas culicis]|eukprot:EPY15597.1 hypothetical protein STCU_11898 [Strigomonas culicis]
MENLLGSLFVTRKYESLYGYYIRQTAVPHLLSPPPTAAPAPAVTPGPADTPPPLQGPAATSTSREPSPALMAATVNGPVVALTPQLAEEEGTRGGGRPRDVETTAADVSEASRSRFSTSASVREGDGSFLDASGFYSSDSNMTPQLSLSGRPPPPSRGLHRETVAGVTAGAAARGEAESDSPDQWNTTAEMHRPPPDDAAALVREPSAEALPQEASLFQRMDTVPPSESIVGGRPPGPRSGGGLTSPSPEAATPAHGAPSGGLQQVLSAFNTAVRRGDNTGGGGLRSAKDANLGLRASGAGAAVVRGLGSLSAEGGLAPLLFSSLSTGSPRAAAVGQWRLPAASAPLACATSLPPRRRGASATRASRSPTRTLCRRGS